MKYTIPVVILMNDCGDGGYTMLAYNTEEEMLADHPAVKDAIEDGVTPEKLAEIKRNILIEDDPYSNGYIGKDKIEIEIVDGVARLSKELGFHVGQ